MIANHPVFFGLALPAFIWFGLAVYFDPFAVCSNCRMRWVHSIGCKFKGA